MTEHAMATTKRRARTTKAPRPAAHTPAPVAPTEHAAPARGRTLDAMLRDAARIVSEDGTKHTKELAFCVCSAFAGWLPVPELVSALTDYVSATMRERDGKHTRESIATMRGALSLAVEFCDMHARGWTGLSSRGERPSAPDEQR